MFRVLRQKVTCTLHQCDVVDWTAKLCVSIQTAITKMKCGLVLLAILASLLHAAFCLSLPPKTVPPFVCPPLPVGAAQPGACVALCSTDADCEVGEICCGNCPRMCTAGIPTPPLPLPTVTPDECPPTPPRSDFPFGPCLAMCTSDADCGSGKKCCGECPRMCIGGIFTPPPFITDIVTWPENPGECPPDVPGEFGTCDVRCGSDLDCASGQKCCGNCPRKCTEAVFTTTLPVPHECPKIKCKPCPNGNYKYDKNGCQTCDCIHQCPVFRCKPCPNGDYKYDENGCQTCDCVTPDECPPTPPRSDFPFGPCLAMCTSDADCGKGKKCCGECPKMCIGGSFTPPPFITDIVTWPENPGECPPDVPGEFGTCDVRCGSDLDCSSGQKCCGNCPRKCTEAVFTTTLPVPQECPKRKCKSCPNGNYKYDKNGCQTCKCVHQCPVFKCMRCPNGVYRYDETGCQTCECECPQIKCAVACKKGFTLMTDSNGCPTCTCVEKNKVGSCPTSGIKDVCNAGCEDDSWCPGNQKCCGGCPRACVTLEKPGKCPAQSLVSLENLKSCKEDCKDDWDCEGEEKCCGDCLRVCTSPQGGKKKDSKKNDKKKETNKNKNKEKDTKTKGNKDDKDKKEPGNKTNDADNKKGGNKTVDGEKEAGKTDKKKDDNKTDKKNGKKKKRRKMIKKSKTGRK